MFVRELIQKYLTLQGSGCAHSMFVAMALALDPQSERFGYVLLRRSPCVLALLDACFLLPLVASRRTSFLVERGIFVLSSAMISTTSLRASFPLFSHWLEVYNPLGYLSRVIVDR